MRKIDNAYINIENKLRVTNQDYSRLVNDIANTTSVDVITGVSLSIATMSYDLYVGKISGNSINPKDYIDIRQDTMLIAKEYISNIVDSLHLSYKDILSAVDEMLKILVILYFIINIQYFNHIFINDFCFVRTFF